jgi:hypothetical protein
MKHFLYPGLPLIFIGAELSAPHGLPACLLRWCLGFTCLAGSLFVAAYLLVRLLKLLP